MQDRVMIHRLFVVPDEKSGCSVTFVIVTTVRAHSAIVVGLTIRTGKVCVLPGDITLHLEMLKHLSVRTATTIKKNWCIRRARCDIRWGNVRNEAVVEIGANIIAVNLEHDSLGSFVVIRTITFVLRGIPLGTMVATRTFVTALGSS